MQTYTIEISEEQLRLVRASIINVLLQRMERPSILTDKEDEELGMIAGMILDVVENKDTDTVHGFCY